MGQQARWNGMCIEDNPIIQKKRYDDALHSNLFYAKQSKEDHEKAWFAQQESPAYLASKNVHQNTADRYYQAGAKKKSLINCINLEMKKSSTITQQQLTLQNIDKDR